MVVLSLGFGVQTAALGILAVRGESPRPDVAIFADTGDESPETYAFAAEFSRWLESHGLRLVTVRRPGLDLVERYTRDARIPMRTARSCTENFKVGPIRKWLRENGCEKVRYNSADRPIMQIGISVDEWHRARTSDVGWIVNAYPLMDLNISRDDCRAIIASEGFEVPPKSGCMCCPWQSVASFAAAALRHPVRAERILAMETTSLARSPHRLLKTPQNMTARQVVEAARSRIPLFDLIEDPACAVKGACFL